MSREQATNFFVSGQSVDINRPPKEAYRHIEYPKMLHHQTLKDPATLKEFKRVTLHNSLHPEKPEILPTVTHAFIVVRNEQEERNALGNGFGLKPPPAAPQAEEYADLAGEVLCSRGCGKVPHRGTCARVAVSA